MCSPLTRKRKRRRKTFSTRQDAENSAHWGNFTTCSYINLVGGELQERKKTETKKKKQKSLFSERSPLGKKNVFLEERGPREKLFLRFVKNTEKIRPKRTKGIVHLALKKITHLSRHRRDRRRRRGVKELMGVRGSFS